MKSKSAIRAWASERRRALNEDYRKQASVKIAEKLMSESIWKEAGCIYLYYGCGDEVLTEALILEALKSGNKVFLPRVVSDSSMVFIQITSLDNMESGAFGIPEPACEGSKVSEIRPDIIIVPCVAVDRSGNRAGHGKGYYDRFFAEWGGNDIPKVCLAFDCQIAEDFETGDTDVRMDMIITEKEIIKL
ncbi:MAG: 5-formyltetrahydrofolate cyclo-ligase [Lachnospiraceae bacterium]|nr:5-formyltetrahydrofolate cyclo-ligase [Lachnospiraceae bacterium]